MNTETRVLRPFESVDALADFIDHIELQVGGQRLRRDGRATLTADEYRQVPVKVVLPYSGAALEEKLGEIDEQLGGLGLEPDDLRFVVNLYTTFLRISEYPVVLPLTDLYETDTDVPLTTTENRPRCLRTSHHGCRVEVSVVLGREKEFAPGRPWRKGTWLERSTFHIGTDVEFSGFTPRPMDADQKARLGLPPSAMRYVVLPGDEDSEFEEVSLDQVELWIDSQILAVIASQPSSVVAQSIQRQLFVDVCMAVSSAALRNPANRAATWNDVSESMIGTIIRGMARRSTKRSEEQTAEACSRLWETLKQDHSKFMAYVEAHAGSMQASLKSLGV